MPCPTLAPHPHLSWEGLGMPLLISSNSSCLCTAANGAFLPLLPFFIIIIFFFCQELSLIISVPSRGNTKQNLHHTQPLCGPTEQPRHPCTPSSSCYFGVQRGALAGGVMVTHPCRWAGKLGRQSLGEGAEPVTTEKDFGSQERRNWGGEETWSLGKPSSPPAGNPSCGG